MRSGWPTRYSCQSYRIFEELRITSKNCKLFESLWIAGEIYSIHRRISICRAAAHGTPLEISEPPFDEAAAALASCRTYRSSLLRRVQVQQGIAERSSLFTRCSHYLVYHYGTSCWEDVRTWTSEAATKVTANSDISLGTVKVCLGVHWISTLIFHSVSHDLVINLPTIKHACERLDILRAGCHCPQLPWLKDSDRSKFSIFEKNEDSRTFLPTPRNGWRCHEKCQKSVLLSLHAALWTKAVAFVNVENQQNNQHGAVDFSWVTLIILKGHRNAQETLHINLVFKILISKYFS